MLKAVIFDMDGVIVNSEPLHHQAYYAMFDEVGIDVTPAYYDSLTGKSTVNLCKQLKSHFDLQLDVEELVSIKRRHYDWIFENDSTFDLINGVRTLIHDYKKNGLTLALASSSSMRSIDRIFQRFELDAYFISKTSGADLKESKPHPEIFIKAARSTGFDVEECMVIEDATNGIEAAKAADIFCVGYDSEHTKSQDYSKADLVIRDYEDIHFNRIKSIFEN